MKNMIFKSVLGILGSCGVIAIALAAVTSFIWLPVAAVGGIVAGAFWLIVIIIQKLIGQLAVVIPYRSPREELNPKLPTIQKQLEPKYTDHDFVPAMMDTGYYKFFY